MKVQLLYFDLFHYHVGLSRTYAWWRRRNRFVHGSESEDFTRKKPVNGGVPDCLLHRFRCVPFGTCCSGVKTFKVTTSIHIVDKISTQNCPIWWEQINYIQQIKIMNCNIFLFRRKRKASWYNLKWKNRYQCWKQMVKKKRPKGLNDHLSILELC